MVDADTPDGDAVATTRTVGVGPAGGLHTPIRREAGLDLLIKERTKVSYWYEVSLDLRFGLVPFLPLEYFRWP